MARRSFNESYTGTPPWDIGEPQPALAAALREEASGQSVLDMGCGTGENAFFAASLGHHVVGIDAAPLAIEKARDKARSRNMDVTFQVENALNLVSLGKKFDIVLDSGLFHVFDDAERVMYEKNLTSVLKPGGRYYLLCFSELEPPGQGPRRVTQDEIRATFQNGWSVQWIREAFLKTNLPWFGGAAKAWLGSIRKS